MARTHKLTNVGPVDPNTGRNFALTNKGEIAQCAECGRALYVGETVYNSYGRLYGREGSCIDTHKGNWREKVAANAAKRGNVTPTNAPTNIEVTVTSQVVPVPAPTTNVPIERLFTPEQIQHYRDTGRTAILKAMGIE